MSARSNDISDPEEKLRKAYLFLKKQMSELFSIDEIVDICLELGLDYENVPHETKPKLVHSLLRYVDHEELKLDLVEILRRERRDIDWPSNYAHPYGTSDNNVEREPKIILGIITENGSLLHHSIFVQPVEQKPNYQDLRSQIKRELYEGSDMYSDSIENDNFLRQMHRERMGFNTDAWKRQQDDFLDDYLDFFKRQHRYNNYLARVRELRFAISNVGEATADGLKVQLQFPGDDLLFAFSPKEDWELFMQIHMEKKPPKPPNPPTTFNPLYRSRQQRMLESLPQISEPSLPQVSQENVRGPKLSRSSAGTTAEYEINRLIHGFDEEVLNGIAFWVTPEAEGRSIPISYKIGSPSLRATILGELTLEVVRHPA